MQEQCFGKEIRTVGYYANDVSLFSEIRTEPNLLGIMADRFLELVFMFSKTLD